MFSLSHLAIPFPLSDPLYGLEPDTSEDYGANLGAMELSALAKQIEFGGRQKSLANPKGLVEELEHEFSRVDTALRALLRG